MVRTATALTALLFAAACSAEDPAAQATANAPAATAQANAPAGEGGGVSPASAVTPEPSTEAARAQIAWDLSSLFDSVEAWDAARQAVLADVPRLAEGEDAFTSGPSGMADVLEARSDLLRRAYMVSTFASLSADEDLRDAEAAGRRSLAQAMFTEIAKANSWIEPATIAMGEDAIEAAIAAEPRLDVHAFSLRDSIRNAPHTLSAEGERILAAASLPLSGAEQVYRQMMNADIPWPTVTLSTGEEVRLNSQGYVKARAADDRADRVKVFEAFYTTFDQYESALGAAMTAHVQGQVFNAQQRGYASAREASLAGDNIPVAVYDTLVAEVNAGLPTLHRYMRLRARMLGLEQASYHDIYPDIVASDEVFDIDRSKEITLAASAPLGQGYLDLLAPAMDADWMHVYPQEGKRSGAYMSGIAYDTHPFVLLNHQDTFNSASTFAHEWGHAIHTLLANETQPFETAWYSIFVAESAAILLEVLLQNHMLENAQTDEERLFFLGYALEQMRGTFFRQTQFAEYEQAIHAEIEEGRALTGERLTAIYDDIVKRYYGHEEGATDVPDLYALEWAYIPHFYFDFYVYQYSTSLAAAVAVADKINAGDTEARDAFLNTLRAGGSDYPYELMKQAGVDLASPEPYRAVIARMDAIMDEIETILDRQEGVAAE